MSYRYLFNTMGHFVAFVRDDCVFSRDRSWIGFIRNGNEVYTSDSGKFLGYITDDDRVVKNVVELPKMPQMRPLPPIPPIPPLPPLPRLPMVPLPPPYVDVFGRRSE